ncbi:MAG: hypothetical protein Fur009_3810 [Candidatus Microgenomates bacterium]
MKGYKIHIKRINQSNGEIIRTIKYLLTPINQNNSQEIFFSNFIFDDLKVRGISSITDFIKHNSNYDLFDFWIDTLKAGVIFQPTKKSLEYFIKVIKNEKNDAELIFDKSNEIIKKYFKKEDFIQNIILSNAKRTTSRKSAFLNELFKMIKDEFKDSKNKIIVDKQLNDTVNFIINSFYNEDGNLKLEGEEKQIQFWKTNFAIDKTLLNKNKFNENSVGDITNFILPEIIKINESISIEELINIRINLAEKYLSLINQKTDKFKIVESFLGLGNNFNSLSNYLNNFYNYLLSKKTDEIIKSYKEIINLNEPEIAMIKEALKYLSDKAQLLEKPRFINKSWQEYRSVFGGKIQSWYSNYVNRLSKSSENYKKIIGNIDQIISIINKYKTNENEDYLNKIVEKTLNLKDVMIKNIDILQVPYKFDIFSDLLADLKTDLNYFYQTYIKKNDDDQINKNPIFKFLFEEIEKPINFYGHSKKEILNKIVNQTAIRINEGLKIIRLHLEEYKNLRRSDFKKSFPELLENYFDKLAKKTVYSKFFYFKYKDILKNYISSTENINDIFNNPEKYTFFKNNYERQKSILIKTISIENNDYLILDLHEKFYNFLINIDQNLLINNPDTSIEYLETAKTFISFCIENNNKKEFLLESNLYNNFEGIKNYIKLFKQDKLNNKDYNKILNQYFFSELKGDLTLSSKKNYIAKYTLQIMNSDQVFPLIIKFKNNQINKNQLLTNSKEIINYPHQYFIVFDLGLKFKKINNQTDKTDTFLINKTGITPIKDLSFSTDNLVYKISSSRYQIQFLDRLIYKPRNWQQIAIKILEPSFILEVNNNIKFDIINNKISLSEKNKKFYVSIPFEIKSINNTSVNANKNNKLYLGIDAGEYGVAYSLVDFYDEKKPKIIKSFYIKSKNIRRIKDHYQKIQEKSKKGVFLSSSNLLNKIRENSINEIRNSIHDIFLKYSPKMIVYEYSISNFETGSGRVTKIYDSIKKSDVPPDNEADKSIIKHVWGRNYIRIGTNASAYASSYTCTHCGRSIFSIIENINNNQIFITQRLTENGLKNIVEISTPYGKLYGYTSEKKYINGYLFKNTQESKKELKKILQNFARPPLDKSEVLLTFKKLDKNILRKIKIKRGNSSIFVCPFADCLHVFDADLQASFIMAVRGYIKDINQNNKDLNIFEETLKYLKKIEDLNYKMLEIPDLASSPQSKNQ